ncbi:DsbC family protein [Glaciimonas immobilis]|uniref:Thiol:disulfide interchange protein n=1 Tax=Glaciimonas immobilis TaxID=728004 RepID=A0A840RZK2_9BURK|nr:DsbC family protein [Glaciimonas immobilis]KAF3998305.1 DsbC family protein [Glaciimonas immobilis]MBB5201921.1 hypothetical protein [Glaciimonas immobilis]
MHKNIIMTAVAFSLLVSAPLAMASNIAAGLQPDDAQRLGTFASLTDSQYDSGEPAPAAEHYQLFKNIRGAFSRQTVALNDVKSADKNLWNRLPMEKSVTRIQGTGKRQIAVFSDPNCSYCKRVEAELAKIKNLTVHTFIFPFLSASSRDKASDVLCAPDPSAAWGDWMLQGKSPARNPLCSSRLQELLDLGRSFDIRGTPVLIFDDGTRISGYAPAAAIEQKLH